MTERKVSTSGMRGIGAGIEGVELSLEVEGLLASPDAHLVWILRLGVAMLGRNSRLIADWTRKDFMFDLNQLLELSATGTEGLRERATPRGIRVCWS